MERRSYLKTVGSVSVASVVGFAGCSAPTAEQNGGDGAGQQPSPTSSPTPSGPQGGQPVQMVTEGEDYYFDPIGLFVESGTTVTWAIESGAHSSTAYSEGTGSATVTRIPAGAEPWNSGTLTEPGATFEHTFQTAGTYDYFCIPHKSLGMVGRIVVDEPGGPAEASMPPDGAVPESQVIVEQGAVSYGEFGG